LLGALEEVQLLHYVHVSALLSYGQYTIIGFKFKYQTHYLICTGHQLKKPWSGLQVKLYISRSCENNNQSSINEAWTR